MFNTLKTKLKKWWKGLLTFLGIGAVALALTIPNGAVPVPTTMTELEKFNEVKTNQDEFIKINRKYKYSKRQQNNGLDYQVTEYLTPNGEVGFNVLFFKTENGKRYFKSIGFGPEGESRTFDWKQE